MARKFTRADLNEKQQVFIDEYIARGGTRAGATEAVKVAYGYSDHDASSAAWRLLKNEKIRDVIVEETLASFAALGAMGAESLISVLETGTWFGQPVKPSDGLKAISQALERGIGPIAHVHNHNVNHELDGKTGKELRAAVVNELRKLPDADRTTMLKAIGITGPGADDGIVDVEFLEVDPDAPWGRKKDGTPKKKPGLEPQVRPKHLQTKWYKPPPGPYARRIAAVKKEKLRLRKAAKEAMKEEPSD